MTRTSAQTALPGHGQRRAIAIVVGIAVGFAAGMAVYLAVFAKMHHELVKAGETGRMWWLLAFVALVFGSGAHSFTFKTLDRRAKRAAESARLPSARVL